MKRTVYNIISFIAVMLIITTACTHDEAEQYPVATDSFTLNISLGKLSTRAISTEEGDHDGNFNEKKINNLDIFFYQGSTLKWHVNSLTYDDGTQKATIPVIAGKRALFENNTTTTYDVYVVANNTADLTFLTEEAANLQALKDLVFQTPGFVTAGGNTAQPSFVMDGMVSQMVNLNNPDLGTVNLKRAASKIRLRLMEVNVPGYTQDGTVTARLTHFTDKTALMDGGVPYTPGSNEWKDTSPRNVATSTAAPFYAYANDWSANAGKETYLELFIPLKDDVTASTKTYKYRVPVTPRLLTGEDAQYMNKLQRNFLYDIDVTVGILGSIEEPPVELSGNYMIKDWSTQEVLVDIKGSHYLVVSERNVIMPNTSSYTLNFNSSIPNVTLVSGSLKATFTYVSTVTGQPVTANVSTNQIPTVTVQSNVASGSITITSPIPVNFIPKDIEFKITNGPLTETITIRQLPATYFTVTKGVSSAHYANFQEVKNAGLNNPYMYAITTLAPAGDIIWGFPPLDANGNTINSAEVANMVSPKFEMASQFGASQPKEYSAGQTQCKNYWEKAEDGTTKYGWRLPTEAEITYIDNLQHNSNNLQGIVMTGKWYWDAYSTNGAYQMQGGSGGNASSAYVRCIRDIKD